MVNAPSFGTMIRDRRQELRLTQEDLATALGITQAHLSRLESDTADPRKLRHEVICNLARELHLSLADLSILACGDRAA